MATATKDDEQDKRSDDDLMKAFMTGDVSIAKGFNDVKREDRANHLKSSHILLRNGERMPLYGLGTVR